MSSHEAVVVAASRSAIGTSGSRSPLARLSAAELAGSVVAAVAAQLEGVPDDVLLGNCMGPGGNVARVAVLEAGLPGSVPAATVDRQCASGLAAVTAAVAAVRADGGAVLAGGVESASTAPWRLWPPVDGREPVRYERAPFAPARLGDPDMGLAADLLAARYAVGRTEQDEYAARSHARAAAARDAGLFDAEVVEVAGVARDERPRSGLTPERLGRLRPMHRPEGTVTVGNSCGINDGAAVVAVVDEPTRGRLGLPGLRVLSTATTAFDPNLPGLGLVSSSQLALRRAGLSWDDMDVIELNEAFAGQVLACCRELDLDPERVCPDGGALALGHPWGASGAVLVVRLFTALVREGRGRRGLAAIAAGGGQGVAVVVEAAR